MRDDSKNCRSKARRSCCNTFFNNKFTPPARFFLSSSRKTNKNYLRSKSFSSDQYVLESQVNFHGLTQENIVEVFPRTGEELIHLEDILAKIQELGDELALVMIGGVNYYTGQLFDMQK